MHRIFSHIVIHYDEISLKGGNKDFFVKQLADNVLSRLDNDFTIERGAGKILFKSNELFGLDELVKFVEQIKFVPGISNFSPAVAVQGEIELIKEATQKIIEIYNPRTFKIFTTRACKDFPLTSMETNCEVGGYILEKNKEISVDVHKPELIIKIEISKNKVWVLGKKYSGIGGLPIGSVGRVVCLLSGGIDSPVAAFQMMKRGAEVIFIHFQNQTINKAGVEDKIERLVEALKKIQGSVKLLMVPFEDLQKQAIAKVRADLRMIIYRRLMFQIAEQLARKEGAQAIVTGDSLAQVASQTLENLAVIYQASTLLKFSPLISFNKTEIIELAKKIGTYDISIEPYADCCNLLVAKHPETRARLQEVLTAEKAAELEEGIGMAVEGTRVAK
ncbi:MAG: tRNA uracil 4-sulfurtransferase ThiI [Patescibacteria group bacterium]